jgi:hypothetical protein
MPTIARTSSTVSGATAARREPLGILAPQRRVRVAIERHVLVGAEHPLRSHDAGDAFERVLEITLAHSDWRPWHGSS